MNFCSIEIFWFLIFQKYSQVEILHFFKILNWLNTKEIKISITLRHDK